MRLAHYLDRIIPDLSAAILRFPVPALYAILLGLYLNVTGSGGLSYETVSLAAAAGPATVPMLGRDCQPLARSCWRVAGRLCG